LKPLNSGLKNSKVPYAIKEAAILFESNSEKDIDIIIGVTAPEQIKRIIG